MSPEVQASDSSSSSVLQQPRKTRKTKRQAVPASGHTSEGTLEDTLLKEMPNQQKNQKKDTKRTPKPPKVKEKICDQVARTFADDLAGGAKYASSSDILEQFISPHQATSTTSTTKMVRIVTTVIEQTQTTKKSTFDGVTSSTTRTMKAKYKISGSTYTLDDLNALTALQDLVDRFGKVSHMGILDKSYTFFVSKSKDAALYFKVLDKVAVVGGDPLCEPEKYDSVLSEFAAYRKNFGWGIAFLGATAEFSFYARGKKWPTIEFGVERVLNPMTNPVLLENGQGKRIICSCKALLKKNVKLGIYIPRRGTDRLLQSQLKDIYAAWCADRNNKPIVQAYMTVLDPFAMPDLMVYIYTRDVETGLPNGFAALRKIVNGYHLDPCIALPGAIKGISELLILSSMALLRGAGVSYLSLGFEPSAELGKITGIPEMMQGMTRMLHKRAFRRLPIGGKQAFFDKFRPDDNQLGNLYLVIPTRGLPGLRHMKALMHTANIDISQLIYADMKNSMSRRTRDEGEKTTGQLDVEGNPPKISEDLSSSDASSREASRKSSVEGGPSKSSEDISSSETSSQEASRKSSGEQKLSRD
jgi:hypothetical protein